MPRGPHLQTSALAHVPFGVYARPIKHKRVNKIVMVQVRRKEILRRFGCFAALVAGMPAFADGLGTGDFTILDDSAVPLLHLDLQEQDGWFSGSGETADGGALPPGTLVLRTGARTGEQVQLLFLLDPLDPAGPEQPLRLIVSETGAVSLAFAGKRQAGRAVPRDDTVAPAPADQPPAAAPSCLELGQLLAETARSDDPDLAAALAPLTAQFEALGVQDQDAATCDDLLEELTVAIEDHETPEIAESCYAVEGVLEEIATTLETRNLPADTQPDRLMASAGMRTAITPDGQNTTATCGRALVGLYAYLDALPVQETSPGMALLDGYRMEPLVNVNLAGEWQLSAGGNRVALWTQGRNTLAYERDDDGRRAIWFWDPRDGLARAGVTRGTLFIEGTRNRGRFEGEARHFVDGCGAYVYPVQGRVRDNETRIRLTGDRPEVDDDCRVTGLSEHSFQLAFQSDNPPGTRNLNVEAQRDPQGAAPMLGVWSDRFRVRNIDRGGALNVRRGPSLNAAVVGSLPHNARDILILGAGCTPPIDPQSYAGMNRRQKMRALSTRWCQVMWNGNRGWVYGRFLRPM